MRAKITAKIKELLLFFSYSLRKGEPYMPEEIDIFDLLAPETIQAVDELGYEFLAKCGYDVEGAGESVAKQEELRKALQEKEEELRYSGAVDDKTGAMMVWFEIYRNGERVAKSRALQFLPS